MTRSVYLSGDGDDRGYRSGPNDSRTNGSSNSKPNSSSGSPFYSELTDRLQSLSFLSFQNCVLLWLGAKGFRDICVLRRSASRGRRLVGGADFIGVSPYDSNVKVAVQVRYWRTPVQRRAVDELWGFMLRQGISQGLIVTNSRIYPKAMAAVSQFPGRPIRLVSVSQFAGSMAALGLGVEPSGRRWVVSESFFRTLGQMRLASSLVGASRPALARTVKPSRDQAVASDDVSANLPPWPIAPMRLWRALLALLVVLAVSMWLSPGGLRCPN